MAMCSYAWILFAMGGYVQLCVAMCGCGFLFVYMSGYAWLCLAMCRFV